MQAMKKEHSITTSEQLDLLEKKYQDSKLPKVTIIIPSFNNAKLLGQTIKSVLQQEYPNFEIIVIDASSTDKTIDVIKNLRDERMRVYTVAQHRIYEMLNKGITHAQGEYVCFLFPGDYYTYIHTVRYMMSLALENNKPDLIYCGTLLRDGRSEVKTLFRDLNLQLLKQGKQPTSLQSCWIKSDVIKDLGKFDPNLKLRGGFDFFCRFSLNERYRYISSKRFYTDYDIRAVTSQMLFTHFFETIQLVWRHFGFMTTLYWLVTQKDIYRLNRHWMKRWKMAFFGK